MGSSKASYQIQHRHLHHTLIEIRRLVFDNLDSDNFLGLQILTFHDLPKGSLAQYVENEVAVPMRLLDRPCMVKLTRQLTYDRLPRYRGCR